MVHVVHVVRVMHGAVCRCALRDAVTDGVAMRDADGV